MNNWGISKFNLASIDYKRFDARIPNPIIWYNINQQLEGIGSSNKLVDVINLEISRLTWRTKLPSGREIDETSMLPDTIPVEREFSSTFRIVFRNPVGTTEITVMGQYDFPRNAISLNTQCSNRKIKIVSVGLRGVAIFAKM